MSKNQRASVIVEYLVVDPHLFSHDDIVNGKRVMGFNRLKIGHRYARPFQCLLRCRDWGLRHVCFFGARKSIRKNLNGHGLVGGKLIRFLLCGDDHTGIPIGRMSLGADGYDGIWDDWSQPCQAFGGTGDNPFVLFHKDGLFLGESDFHAKHIAFLKFAVLRRRHRVLHVSIENQGIGFFPGDAALLYDIVGRAQGAGVAGRFKVETVHHPALEVRLSAEA